jgi:hypothetical protein
LTGKVTAVSDLDPDSGILNNNMLNGRTISCVFARQGIHSNRINAYNIKISLAILSGRRSALTCHPAKLLTGSKNRKKVLDYFFRKN